MMAPKFERARVLAEALEIGAHELDDPIDKMTVSASRISVFAGRACLELSYAYHNAYAENGGVKPGSGHWSVSIVSATKENRFAALARGIFEKITPPKGRR
jgi:hypothetical protein